MCALLRSGSVHVRTRMQDRYPDRGQSPERLKQVAEGKKKGVNLTAPPVKKGYVPPAQRGADGSRSKVLSCDPERQRAGLASSSLHQSEPLSFRL